MTIRAGVIRIEPWGTNAEVNEIIASLKTNGAWNKDAWTQIVENLIGEVNYIRQGSVDSIEGYLRNLDVALFFIGQTLDGVYGHELRELVIRDTSRMSGVLAPARKASRDATDEYDEDSRLVQRRADEWDIREWCLLNLVGTIKFLNNRYAYV